MYCVQYLFCICLDRDRRGIELSIRFEIDFYYTTIIIIENAYIRLLIFSNRIASII